MATSPTVPRRGADATTLAEAFRLTVAERPDQPYLRTLDGSVDETWAQAARRVDAIAGGLRALGLQRGATLGLLTVNRPEFNLCDLAAMTLGATPFSIYQQYVPEQIAYVVGDAEARVLVCDRVFLDGALEAREQLPRLEHLVLVDPVDGEELPDGVTTLDAVEAAGEGFDGAAASRQIAPEDVVTLVYTSGTTGPPKGVQLSHANLMAACRATRDRIDFADGSRVISWLPTAHIAERTANHYLPIVFGLQVTTCPDPKRIGEHLVGVRPTWFFAVPRVWEKLKAGVEAKLAGLPAEARAQAEGAIDAATQRVWLLQRGEPVPEGLEAGVARAEAGLFAGIRQALGLDQLVAANVGAAPTPPEVLAFFLAIGVPLGELWGMSETCGAGLVNPPDGIRIGTVGRVTGDGEVRLADDGELLIRGGYVMPGYRGLPERTAEALDAEGWLHTGDVAEIDADGYVRIVDRKKELIINAAGKNMSPANIEATLKGSSPLIGQACVVGDRRPYNVALVVLDADYAPAWAAGQGIEADDLATLAADERVRAAVAEEVERANAKLARVEQVKRFHLVTGDWLPGGEELTPTMKLRRKPIGAKYEREIEGLYDRT